MQAIAAFRCILLVALTLTLHSCTASICSVSIGDSVIQFRDSSTQSNMWRIDAILCDGKPYNSSLLDPMDYFAGSCSSLGDTDVELFYMFQMGSICYNDYTNVLRAKANVTMTSEFDLFTTR